MFESDIENDLKTNLMYSHDGYDKLCIYSCTIYETNEIIKAVDCFSHTIPDTNHYVVYVESTRVKLLDTIKQEVMELIGHRAPVLSVICCDKDEVITMGQDGSINIWHPWEPNGLQWKNSLSGSRNNLTSLSVSKKADGAIIVTSKDGYMCAWNRETSLSLHSSQVDLKGLYSSAICDVTNLLLVGGFGRLHIHEKDFNSFSHVTTLGGHNGPILSVISANGYVITGGEDKAIVVHKLDTFKQISRRVNAHTSAVTSLVYCSDENKEYVISGSRDSYLNFWSFPKLELLCNISGHQGMITSLTISFKYAKFLNRPALISCSSDKTLKIWKLYRFLNWERRKVLMLLLVESNYIICQSGMNFDRHVAQLLQKTTLADPSSSPTPSIVAESSNLRIAENIDCIDPEINHQRLLRDVFGNKRIVRELMSFI
jgi:WD40 repeat protein